MIEIANEVLEEAADYCLTQLPKEACGVFMGSVNGSDGLRINRWLPITNRSEQPRVSFAFDKDEWVELLYKQSETCRLVGTFHSHPHGEARLSAADLSGLSLALPTCWIVSLHKPGTPEWQAFRMLGDSVSYEQTEWRVVDEE
jgi:proteasome lid subunit RPN8/RPN11